MQASNTVIRASAGVLGGLTLASVAWGLVLVFGHGQANWGMFGFEVVIVAAGVFGLLLARNRPQQVAGMAFACIAGTILVSAGLGLVAMGFGPGAVLRHPLFLMRFALVGGFCALAVWATLGADPRAWRLLIRGIVLAVMSMGIIALGITAQSTWLAKAGNLQVVALVVSLLLLTVLGGVFCIGLHLVIRAFEVASSPSGDAA